MFQAINSKAEPGEGNERRAVAGWRGEGPEERSSITQWRPRPGGERGQASRQECGHEERERTTKCLGFLCN
ncbi:hypothetical protein PBY51_015434 [Eleginops maclovinus]|uniref:Uncharacterized protein n=1 Tax=Eleginops maclovinus TaxID=56733 RepID=A0AAN7X3M5_ELEMC|nr:hypothetical protein PBY51_015434 [Eleginops maclovinus]